MICIEKPLKMNSSSSIFWFHTENKVTSKGGFPNFFFCDHLKKVFFYATPLMDSPDVNHLCKRRITNLKSMSVFGEIIRTIHESVYHLYI